MLHKRSGLEEFGATGKMVLTLQASAVAVCTTGHNIDTSYILLYQA
jgi:hypothetical protein